LTSNPGDIAGAVMLLSGVVIAVFAGYVGRRRQAAASSALTGVLAAAAVWSVLYALELASATPKLKLLWGDLKYLGICLLPPAWLLFALQYTGRARRVTRRLVAALALEPVLVLGLLALPATHDLIRFLPGRRPLEALPVVALGPVFWLHYAYTTVLLLWSTALFVITLVRVSRLYWRQSRILMIVLTVPWAVNALFVFNVGWFGRVDLTPVALSAVGLVLVRGVFRFGLLDVVPVARSVIVETMSDAVIVLDPYQRVVDLNPAAQQLMGCSGDAAIGQPAPALLPEHAALLKRLGAQAAAGDGAAEVTEELRLLRDDGPRDFELRMQRLGRERDQSGYLLSLRDITQRKGAEQRLARLAHYDPLTELPNRKLFSDRLGQALAGGSGPLAVLFLDLDRFKQVNDTLGHDLGDLLLQAVARRLAARVRDGGTVARFGGDEFTVLLPGTDADGAAAVAERLLLGLAQPCTVAGTDLHVSASIGIAVWPQDGVDQCTLLRHADTAMYRAKAAGQNRYEFYTVEHSLHALEHLHLEGQLWRALDSDQLRLRFQPYVSAASGRIAGMEALIRWQHPSRGLMLPGKFIPMAEESGLIVALGRWVLEESCPQAVRWRDVTGELVPVSVNLSARELQNVALVREVGDVLTRTGLEPEALAVELSERLVLGDASATLSGLQELKTLGVQLALDDFGTGYTSVGQLKRLPLDLLKIDRLLVGGLTRAAEDELIMGAIVTLAHALGLKVVAEGVECSDQLARLCGLHCDLLQGFYFSPPVDAGSATELLVMGHCRPGRAGPLLPAGDG
jgi:diguanylate cyclase (GGDEF)-like protein/PAS domain S-box-containing protein